MLSDIVDTTSPVSIASTLILLPLLYIFYNRLIRQPTVFDQLPWPGLKPGFFGRLKSKFDTSSRRDAVEQAIKEYSANDKPFIWQSMLGRPMLVLPPSYLRWFIDQPHDDLSSNAFFQDTLALATSTADSKVHEQPLHTKVVQHNLNRALGWTPTYILDETVKSFDDFWGHSTEWHEEVVWSSMIKITTRTVQRMFIGEPLCRDNDFLDAIVEWAETFIGQGIKLRPLPMWVRRVIQYPMTAPARKSLARISKHIGPIIERRKADYERKLADPTFEYDEPNDLLQWIIQHSYESPDTSNRRTLRLVKRYMTVNFAAVHTTSANATGLILDLASTKPEDNYIGQIRDQIIEVSKECGGVWTKAHLTKLNLLDSALRETLRINSAGGPFSPQRKVTKRGGITHPSGLHIPQGAHVGFPAYGQHFPNEDMFKYEPFRWAGKRAEKGRGLSDMIEERNLQATSTSKDFLPFGHGRDACPGRFFAVQEIKMFMVHMLLNYEFQHKDERRGAVWLGDMAMAPTKTTIMVRKVKSPVSSGQNGVNGNGVNGVAV